MKGEHRHHSNYVTEQQVIHKCLLTYRGIFTNMPFQWYVQNVHDSINRKGYTTTYETVERWLALFLKDDIDFCPHCYGKGK